MALILSIHGWQFKQLTIQSKSSNTPDTVKLESAKKKFLQDNKRGWIHQRSLFMNKVNMCFVVWL